MTSCRRAEGSHVPKVGDLVYIGEQTPRLKRRLGRMSSLGSESQLNDNEVVRGS